MTFGSTVSGRFSSREPSISNPPERTKEVPQIKADMMWIKLVPKATPNAGGRWIQVEDQKAPGGINSQMSAYAKFVPEDEFLVALSRMPPEGSIPATPVA